MVVRGPRISYAAAVRPILLFLISLGLCACHESAPDTRSYLIRLTPGQELKTEIMRLTKDKRLEAASIVSAVGSLTDVGLRLADKAETTRYHGHFEVVALSGYLAADEFHVHMAVSDGDGKTVGGHVMDNNVVYTTLVVVIQEHLRYRYRREVDPATGRKELVIKER